MLKRKPVVCSGEARLQSAAIRAPRPVAPLYSAEASCLNLLQITGEGSKQNFHYPNDLLSMLNVNLILYHM